MFLNLLFFCQKTPSFPPVLKLPKPTYARDFSSFAMVIGGARVNGFAGVIGCFLLKNILLVLCEAHKSFWRKPLKNDFHYRAGGF